MTFTQKVFRRLNTFRFVKRKHSTKNLDRLCKENKSDLPTLVVHSEDVDYRPWFPNGYAVTKRKDEPADLHVDLYYREISKIETSSYPIILCTGLLEHIPDPERLINEFTRILQPDGKLIMSASAVFSFHEGPDNFFHFTPYGMKILLKDYSDFNYRGASKPFETIGILLQRILLQAEIFFVFRPFIELLSFLIPLFDYTVIRQYDGRSFKPDRQIDSLMPSNVQVTAKKK